MAKKRTELEIKIVDINSLNGLPNNVRKHQDEDIEFLRKQLRAYGQYKNIVVCKNQVRGLNNVIIAGNGLWQAMKLEGYIDIAIRVMDIPEKEAVALAIQDNRSAELSEWDYKNVKETIIELDELNFELEDLGWDMEALEDIMTYSADGQQDHDPKADEVPDIDTENTICQEGDLWLVGRHRLLCGDCTDKSLVDYLMDGKKADMVFTDPPYGMNLDTDFSGMKGIAGGNKYLKVTNDNISFNPEFIFSSFPKVKEVFLWGADYYSELIPSRNDGSWFVWDKTEGGISPNTSYDKMFGSNFELCWSKQKHKRALARVLWKGIFGLSKEDTKARQHPTQKPTRLIEWFTDKFSTDNDLIIDLFLGSGSTLIACEKTNRICYGMEIEPYYCDVIIKRYIDYTGKNDVVRIKDNKKWSELCKPE